MTQKLLPQADGITICRRTRDIISIAENAYSRFCGNGEIERKIALGELAQLETVLRWTIIPLAKSTPNYAPEVQILQQLENRLSEIRGMDEARFVAIPEVAKLREQIADQSVILRYLSDQIDELQAHVLKRKCKPGVRVMGRKERAA